MLSRGGKEIHRIAGGLIPDVVQVGPAPLTTTAAPRGSAARTAAWCSTTSRSGLRDFAIAVDDGPRLPRPLGPGDEAGFDELIVLGLKHSADVAETEALVGELLAGHHYSAKGLALVPQGTATNNTSGEDAGLDTHRLVRRRELRRRAAAARTGECATDLDAGERRPAARGLSRPRSPSCSRACRTPTGATTPRPWR